MWPWFVLCVALFVRLWGIEWQLPAALYFDEMKYVAWAGDAKDDATAVVRDLRNPTFFHHLLQTEYAIADLVRGNSRERETAVFELWLARLTSATMGTLACVFTALAAAWIVRAVARPRAHGPPPSGSSNEDALPSSGPPSSAAPVPAAYTDAAAGWAGFTAGMILALAPLHVHLSHYAVNDAAASLFLAGTLYAGARALATGGRRALFVAGLLAGIAFSTKYSFAVGVLLPLVAALAPLLTRSSRPEDGLSPGPPLRTWQWALREGLPRLLLVAAGFLLGAVLAAPEILVSPAAVLAGLAEQARLGRMRWNGQSEAPIWRLYLETLVHGLGWPTLLAAAAGCAALAMRRWSVLVAVVVVPAGCLAVMLRQELFFARFALPLLPSLAILAGVGTVALVRWATAPVGAPPRWVALLTLAVLAAQVVPAAATTVRHNQLATTMDTRVLARHWLQERLDGARVVTEVYGLPIAWEGNEGTRSYRLQRVSNFAEIPTVARLACDGNRFFVVASLTAERELARRDPRAHESGYDLLARKGRPVAAFDPFVPGQTAPAHPDNTGIPFWYLERYVRPGPTIIIYEMSSDVFDCSSDGR